MLGELLLRYPWLSWCVSACVLVALIAAEHAL